MANVTVVNSRLLIRAPFGLKGTNGLPLIQPLTLDLGQVVRFQGNFTPTAADIAAGSAASNMTVSGRDTTAIGGPNASVTNSITTSCNICAASACLAVTKACTSATTGQPQTISGVVTNCGSIAITNIAGTDNIYGSVTNIASLAAGASSR